MNLTQSACWTIHSNSTYLLIYRNSVPTNGELCYSDPSVSELTFSVVIGGVWYVRCAHAASRPTDLWVLQQASAIDIAQRLIASPVLVTFLQHLVTSRRSIVTNQTRLRIPCTSTLRFSPETTITIDSQNQIEVCSVPPSCLPPLEGVSCVTSRCADKSPHCHPSG